MIFLYVLALWKTFKNKNFLVVAKDSHVLEYFVLHISWREAPTVLYLVLSKAEIQRETGGKSRKLQDFGLAADCLISWIVCSQKDSFLLSDHTYMGTMVRLILHISQNWVRLSWLKICQVKSTEHYRRKCTISYTNKRYYMLKKKKSHFICKCHGI